MRLAAIVALLLSLALLVLVEARVIHTSRDYTTNSPETHGISQDYRYSSVLLSEIESYLSDIGERLASLSKLVSSSIERLRSHVSLLVISIRGLLSEARDVLDQVIGGGDFHFAVNITLSTRRGEVKHSFEFYSNRGVAGSVLRTLRSTLSSVFEKLSRIIRDLTSVFIGVVLYTSSIATLIARTVKPR